MDQATKVRENRLRAAAKRRGLRLEKSYARDPQHALYGTYQLAGPDGSVVAAREHPAFGRTYGLSLDEVAKELGES